MAPVPLNQESLRVSSIPHPVQAADGVALWHTPSPHTLHVFSFNNG